MSLDSITIHVLVQGFSLITQTRDFGVLKSDALILRKMGFLSKGIPLTHE